jgi:DNA repair protein RadC
MKNSINSEASILYKSHPYIKPFWKAETDPTRQDALIAQAKEILLSRMVTGASLCTPSTTFDFLILHLTGMEHEVFGCIMLNSKNCVLSVEELFRGTIDGASVYPREVVKAVLAANAAAVIFYHNHPSGMADPSPADITITDRLTKALTTIDVRVLDHVIVGSPTSIVSFAERGLL